MLIAGLGAGISVGVAGQASPGVPSAVIVAKGDPLCSLAGVRYVGSATLAPRLCFTVSRDGRKLLEYGFVTRLKCSDGKARTATLRIGKKVLIKLDPDGLSNEILGDYEPPAAIMPNGAFADVPSDQVGARGSSLRGRLEGSGKASGTLRERIEIFHEGERAAVCDSGTVRWSARKAAR